MQLKRLGTNLTLLQFKSGAEILVSYETPVAVRTANGNIYVTDQDFSKTTSKHINQYLIMRIDDYKKAKWNDTVPSDQLELWMDSIDLKSNWLRCK